MPVEIGWKRRDWVPRVPFYVLAVVYLTLPALLLLAGVPVFGAMDHREINLDYLLIGAVSVFLPRSMGFILLLAEFVMDCFCQICIIYHLAPSQLLRLMHFLALVPASRLAGGVVVLLFAIVICGALSLLRPRQREELWAAGTMLGLTIVLLALDFTTGQNLWRRDAMALPRIVRTPLISLVLRERGYRAVVQQSSQGHDSPIPSASANLKMLLQRSSLTSEKFNVVLVLVESWGELNDAQMAGGLSDAYDNPQISNNYRVEQGQVPFHDFTVSGEARELCQSGMGLGLLQISDVRAANCLPILLHDQGYHTTAIHGFAGGMYLRSQWYPKMGFDETLFLPDLEKAGLARCAGAFPGICDSSIAQFIGQQLLAAPEDQPQFIYWVTLNSHIPVPARPDIEDDGSCVNRRELQASRALCSWYRLVRAVHKAVAEDAIALADRPTAFVVVGDHAPPFGDPQLREQFSATDVPYVALVPYALDRDRRVPGRRVPGDRMLMAKTTLPRAKPGTAHEATSQTRAF